MLSPQTRRVLIFAATTYLATIVALFVAFLFDLQNPWWAMLTVFIAQPLQPLTGAIWAKSAYRVIGTIVGGVLCVALVPLLASYPTLLLLALGVWLGICVYAGSLDRSPRSYAFFLSGYTVSFVGLPAAIAPENIFNVAVVRVEEIVIGVLALAIAQSLIFPRSVGPVVIQKLDAIMALARQWTSEGLLKLEPASSPRHLASSLTEIDLLATDWYFEGSFSKARQRALRVLEKRLVLLLPAIAAVEDRIQALKQAGAPVDEISQLTMRIGAWMADPVPSQASTVTRLLNDVEVLMPALDSVSAWPALLRSSFVARMSELVIIWSECLALASIVRNPGSAVDVPIALLPDDARPRSLHVDHGVALLSACVAALVVFTIGEICVALQWQSGTYAVALAAGVSALFVSFDDPTPILRNLVIGLLLALPVTLLYEFAILPTLDGFPLLAISLFPVLFPVLILYQNVKRMPMSFGMLAGFSLGLALQPTFASDITTVLNNYVGLVIGPVLTIAIMGLLRVIPTGRAIDRLLRAGWKELSNLIRNPEDTAFAAEASRMLDRVGLLIPRLAILRPADEIKVIELLRDMRLTFAIAELKLLRAVAVPLGNAQIDDVLTALSGHFDRLACGKKEDVPEVIVAKLDNAIRDVLQLERQQDKQAGIDAILNLRRLLFPTFPAYSVGS